MLPVFTLRAGATLALALAAALACVWLRTPLPWMIGPLLATSIASILGAPTRSSARLRNGGQWVIGTALGLYFTPQVGALVASLWWAVLLGIVWALGIGLVFGWWLHRGHAGTLGVGPREQRATTFFAGAIGGASEMTLLAERAGGRTDLVAAAHSLRLVMVTLTIPFAMTLSGQHGIDATLPGARHFSAPGLLLLLAATACGAWVAEKAGRANPWFMGALIVAMAVTLAGIELSSLPTWLTNAAQLVIGVSLGVRFQGDFLRAAPRWLRDVALGTLAMIVLCAGFAFALARLSGLHPATLVLGTSPGGIAEMAITAKVLQLGVPVVTAFQVCRLVAVLLVTPVMYRWMLARGDPGAMDKGR